DKDIPAPPVGQKHGRWATILRDLNPGDSFLLENRDLRMNVYTAAKRLGIKVRGEMTKEGFRMWVMEKQP
ncbi:hypothetical protein HY440_01190, partial [Candidatus Microgenomates bacterium]|nr:hypothetical protein [Candidatus Microgenomates bacterium]